MLLTEEKYLTVEEVSQLLRIHAETVKGLLRSGKLPGRKVGNQWRINKRTLEEYMRGDDTNKK